MGQTKGNSRLKRKVRGSYAISTVSIALVLFLLAGVGYIIWNLSKATDGVKERMTLYVMLSDAEPAEVKEEVGYKLRSLEGVKEALFVSKADAAAEMKEFVGGDVEEFLSYNPLPDSYEVRLRASESPKALVASIESQVSEWKGVDEVVYQRAVVENMDTNLGKFKILLLLFGGALLVVSLVLLRNTIRMSVFAHRTLINTMKLVGASKGFIKRPFLVDSLWQGVVAALLASGLFWGMVIALNEGLPYVMLVSSVEVLATICGGILVGGVLISVLFTNFALNKFIRMNSSKIHIY
ncbi:MAG: permease-like cell division protein FtsX [Tidjanibacter sp.]|nr:permease-like cell division protein FtsX [Tidjanibacter sp.]MBR7128796.1 permease-like cell division protein FtsX [Tidjanibacter sp.]